MTLTAPFPWFGGKSLAAPLVWDLLGDVDSYVEPFMGSLAVLLARPTTHKRKVETVNDADGLLVNAWRAIKGDPEAVARWADWPVSEADLEARHWWLVQRREAIRAALADPDWFDAKAAGWWIWGACCWIGSGWCSGDGPWFAGPDGWEDHRQLPHLSTRGQGIHRQLPHLYDAGRGANRPGADLLAWLTELAQRLREVRIAHGDWSRLTTYSATKGGGQSVGVFLDPPYPAGWSPGAAYAGGGAGCWDDVCAWAAAAPPEWRVIVCGYEGLWTPPPGWLTVPWRSRGGYQGGSGAERLWASPSCLQAQASLFGGPR